MQDRHPTLSSYHFKRAKTDGLIEVLNEGSYVMAEYSERTGIVKWQRVVLATQKEKIEKWLFDHYPAHPRRPKRQPKVAAAARPVDSLRFSGKMKRIPQVLQLPVVVQGSGPPSLELQRLQEFDFLFRGVAA